MSFDSVITYRGIIAPDIPKRLLNQAFQESYEPAGELWHKEFRDEHFTNRGATKYGYTPRQGDSGTKGAKIWKRSYQGRKLRAVGHTRPLELTGESKELTKRIDIRATSKRGRIVIHARKFNFKPAGSSVNMRQEIETVLPQEAERMWDAFDESVENELILLRYERQFSTK